jgi:hypothetical protein
VNRLLIVAAMPAIMSAVTSRASDQAEPPALNPKSPQYQARGEQARSYVFPGTNESIPYRLYVPSTWTPTTRMPS